MPTNPASVVLQFHRHRVIVRNTSPSWISRVQDVSIEGTGNADPVFELGNVSPVGIDADLVRPRATITRNMVDTQLEWAFADKTSGPVTLADILNYTSASVFRLVAPEGAGFPPASFLREEALLDAVVTSIRYDFEVGRALQETWTVQGKRLIVRTSGFIHDWGSFDTARPGAIRGRDAVLRVAGVGPTDTLFRVQRFSINVDFRADEVEELGNRALAGIAREPARITIDLDIAEADNQPDDLFYQAGGGIIDLQDYRQGVSLALLVFDPAQPRPTFGQAESPSAVLKSFEISGACAYSVNSRAQVRGMSTRRYSLTVVRGGADGGLTVRPGAPAGMTG
jgi:hypothetical protein